MSDEQGLDALEGSVVEAVRSIAADTRIGILRYRFLEVGRVGTYTSTIDGRPEKLPWGKAPNNLRRQLRRHRRQADHDGRHWMVATIDAAGEDVAVEFDYERPPPPWKVHFRVVGAYMSELELLPRAPSVVPGWMKVELAQVGAWDLVADEPRWNQDFEPTGVPQSPGSVGVAPPEGAEWAIGQPLPHEDLDAMNRLAIRYAEEEERRTGVFPPELVAFRKTWA